MFPFPKLWGCKYTDKILIINNFINNTSRISQLCHYDYGPSRQQMLIGIYVMAEWR